MEFQDFLDRLRGVSGGPDQYTARCPAHDDHNASLSIGRGAGGRILVKCFAGCELDAVVGAVGLSARDLFEDAPTLRKSNKLGSWVIDYVYWDADGEPLFRKRRYRQSDGGKTFIIEQWSSGGWIASRGKLDGVPYNLPEVVKSDIIWFCEGEKDADALTRMDMTTTTLHSGANSQWRPAYDAYFRGKKVRILPDNDDPGRKYADTIARALHGVAASVKIIDLKLIWPELPEKGDVYDLLQHEVDTRTFLEALASDDIETPEYVATVSADGMELQTISARELQEKDLPPLVYVVGEILPQGLAILVAPSKYGKSWMMLNLGLSIASGKEFLGYPTTQGGVLYLALEDGYRRIKERLSALLNGAPAPDNFHIAITAHAIDTGLADQVAEYIKRRPDTKLVVIDVFQRVRPASSGRVGAYEKDYSDLGAIKAIADKHEICVLVVHHVRKMRDSGDVFNNISGTNGIMGSCDTIWVLHSENRDDQQRTLHVTGRDPEEQALIVERDGCWWRRIGTVEEEAAKHARRNYDNDPAVKTIKELLKSNPLGFEVSASEFFEEMGSRLGDYGGHTPISLGKHFPQIASSLLRFDDVLYIKPRTTRAKKHGFKRRASQPVLLKNDAAG